MNPADLELQNIWWRGNIENDFHLRKLRAAAYIYHPHLLDQRELRETSGIYTLIGPRQVGKTTYLKLLIQELLKEHAPSNLFYFSCENSTKEALREVLFLYLQSIAGPGKKFIFLDEVSLVEGGEYLELELYNKGLLEEVTIINSGSSSLNLKKSSERLPGRKGSGRIIYFFPLSFREFVFLVEPKAETLAQNPLAFLDTLQKLFLQYVLASGFPKVINEYYTGKIDDLTYAAYKDWIEGEIAKAKRSVSWAYHILKRIMESRTSLTNWDSIAQQSAIKNPSTVAEYVGIFDSLFLVKIIYQVGSDLKVREAKNKKIYFFDHFFISVIEKNLLNINNYFDYYQQRIKDNDYLSKIVENIVFSNVLKFLVTKGYGIENTLFFWRSKSQQEIDFVVMVRKGEQKLIVPIEVKYRNQVERNRIKTFQPIILSKETIDKENSIYPVSVFLFTLEEFIKI